MLRLRVGARSCNALVPPCVLLHVVFSLHVDIAQFFLYSLHQSLQLTLKSQVSTPKEFFGYVRDENCNDFRKKGSTLQKLTGPGRKRTKLAAAQNKLEMAFGDDLPAGPVPLGPCEDNKHKWKPAPPPRAPNVQQCMVCGYFTYGWEPSEDIPGPLVWPD
eukprot:g77045.t1